MPSITTWTRLEPDATHASMAETLKACIYDPLWMLSRQWQLGEFQGVDCGSPVSATLRGECAQLTRYLPGTPPSSTVQGQRYDTRQIPLETLVERERVRPNHQLNSLERLYVSAEAGQHFLRLLARETFGPRYHAAFISTFPMPTLTTKQTESFERNDLCFLVMMSGRVPDGAALAAAFRQPALPSALNIARAHQTSVQNVAKTFLRWYAELFSEPVGEVDTNSSWSSQRMEYAFSTSAPSSVSNTPSPSTETVLTAREYYSGDLDWFNFDLNPTASLGADADRVPGQNPLPIIRTVIPASVSYRGMPEPRWWEFENASVDFGGVDPEPEDLARMLLIEFAITYGNDWFVIPVDLPIGSLCQIQSLVVTDTFGVRTLIPSISASTHPSSSAWRMYRLSEDRMAGSPTTGHQSQSDMFFLPPTLMRTMEGKPLEEVLFLRDEMANLVWGVERFSEGLSGRAVNRRETYFQRQRPREEPTQPASKQEALYWRLATEVPDYWIPLIPVQIEDGGGAILFRRGTTLREDGSVKPQTAQSHILLPDPGNRLDIYEEEVPREGIRVTRNYQYARWVDGAPLLWIGRRKGPGRGEGTSGLRFDIAERPENL